MKIMQEENLHQVEQSIRSRYDIDLMSGTFFVLGMLICGFLLHLFIF